MAMAEETTQPQPEAEPESTPLELALPVSQRVQIRSIVLAESVARRSPDADLKKSGVGLKFDILSVGVGTDPDAKLIFVKPEFSLTTFKEGDDEVGSILAIQATFVLMYAVESLDGLSEENLDAFGATNGVFNAWPYWREYVQSTVGRMGLPSIAVPVYRL